MEHPGVVVGNFAQSFSLNFWTFDRSLWSGHHWKDLFLPQKLSMDDANFGQKWWRQKRRKGQGSSRAVTGGTGVNGLILSKLILQYYLELLLCAMLCGHHNLLQSCLYQTDNIWNKQSSKLHSQTYCNNCMPVFYIMMSLDIDVHMW